MRMLTVSLMMFAAMLPRSTTADPITVSLSRQAGVGASIAVPDHPLEKEIVEKDADSLSAFTSVSVEGNSVAGRDTLLSSLSPDSRRLVARDSDIFSARSVAGNATASVGGLSSIVWEFRLDQPHEFDLFSTFDPQRTAVELGNGQLTTVLSLLSHGVFVREVFRRESFEPTVVNEHRHLGVGTYLLNLDAFWGLQVTNAAAADTSSFSFAFDLNPTTTPPTTPEPGSLGLVAGAFVMGAAWLRKGASS